MTATNPIERLRVRSLPSMSGPHIIFAGALTAAVATAAVLAQSLSKDHVLPAVSTLLFVLAAAVALIGWRRPTRGPRLSYWDVAGVLTFIGICVAAAVEPDQMVRLVGTDHSP
jgi:hypothetical protein